MAAFTAASRDFAASLLPVGLTEAPDGFWVRDVTVLFEM